jgi:hypothetical protein
MEVKYMSHEVTVDGSAERAEAYAARLGRKANQSSVLVFHEDASGTATRFVYKGFKDRDAAVRLTRTSRIEGGSIGEDSMTVIAVNEHQEAAARDIARELGVRPKRTSGRVVFIGKDGR